MIMYPFMNLFLMLENQNIPICGYTIHVQICVVKVYVIKQYENSGKIGCKMVPILYSTYQGVIQI